MSRSKPAFYASMKKTHPDFIGAVENLGVTLRDAGPLEETTSQLVQLAAAAASRSEGAVHSNVKRALEAGVEPAAIRHALILLTSTIGFPAVMAALSWASDVIDAE